MSDTSGNEFLSSSFFLDASHDERRVSPFQQKDSDLFRGRLKTPLNFVDECNSYTYTKKRQYDIKKFALHNVVVIGIIITADIFEIYVDSTLTDYVKSAILFICACNLIYFLISYYKLFRTFQEQKKKLKTHFDDTFKPETKESVPELVNLAPAPVAEVIKSPSRDRTLGSDYSFESGNSFASKNKNTMFSQVEDLVKYLCDYKKAKKEEVVALSYDNSMPTTPFDFWTAENRKDVSPNSLDVSPLLRSSQYQMSYTESASPSAFWGSPDPSKTSDFLVKWICNLRSWFSGTILKRLVEEIEVVNRGLQREGMVSCLVGTASIDTLINTANNHVILQKIPNITFLVPFLQISTNQQYVVRRIRDLAKGSSMNCFNWRSGGNYDNKIWESHLPSDAELVMHLFLTYLDSRLPLLAERPSAKPFSSQYFAKSPNSPRKTQLSIVQDGTSPPHYQIMSNSNLKNIPPGRNNVFCTIVEFLRLVKKTEHGNLGNMNWNRGGINMLWIIEKTQI